MDADLLQLSAYRLQHRLTYRELAQRIAISFPTLYRLLNTANPRPYETTRVTIHEFLDRERKTEARKIAAQRRARRRDREDARVSP